MYFIFCQLAEDDGDKSSHCEVCNKHFNSHNAYENHVKSKRHKEQEAKPQRKHDTDVAKRNTKNAEKGLEETKEKNEKVLEKDAKNVAMKEEAIEMREESTCEASGTSGVRSKVTARDVAEEDDDEGIHNCSCTSRLYLFRRTQVKLADSY